jgi:hypothetical protein
LGVCNADASQDDAGCEKQINTEFARHEILLLRKITAAEKGSAASLDLGILIKPSSSDTPPVMWAMCGCFTYHCTSYFLATYISTTSIKNTYPELSLVIITSFHGPNRATMTIISTRTADFFDIIPGVIEFHHGMTANIDKKEAITAIVAHHDCFVIKPIAAAKNAPIDISQKIPKTFPTAD